MISKKTSVWMIKSCGVVVFFLGIIFLSSLLLHKIPLVQLVPTYTPIKFNTTLSFILSGLGLLGLSTNYNKLAILCGIGLLPISGLTLLEYGFNHNLGVDQFFLKSYISFQTLYPGRMAPITAWGFFLASLILLNVKASKPKGYYFLIRLFAACILIAGVVPLAGYMTGVEMAYSFGQFSAMSPQAAVVFILMGLGFSAYAWQDELPKSRSILAIWLSVLISSMVCLFSIALWMESMERESKLLILHLQEEGQLVKHRIVDEMNYSILAQRRMAQRWEIRGGTPQNEWRNDVHNYISDTNALKVILWADNKNQVRWVEPLISDELNQFINFDEANKNLFKVERDHSRIIISHPINFMNQYPAIIVFVPLYVKQQFQGYIIGVYDTERLVTQALSPQTGNLFYTDLKDGDKLIYSSAVKTNTINSISVVFPLFNKNWTLTISPRKEFFEQNSSFLPYLELLSGVLFSLLIGSTFYYAITAVQRNRLLTEKSEALDQSERRHQQLVDDIHDYAIFWLDLEGKVETWNNGAERIYGFSSEEIIKSNFSVLFSEEEIKNKFPQKILEKAIFTGKFEGESEYIRKDLTKFGASLIVEVLKNSAGNLIGFAMIVRDITQRRLLEAERSKLISIIDESPDFIGMADLQGNLLYHNRSAKKMIGLAEDADLSIMKIANMHPLWAFNLVYNQGIPAVFKEGTWTAETALLHQQTGKEISVLQTLSLYRDPLGNPICLTTVMRDITERKKAEEALKNSEAIFRSSMEYAAIGMALVSPTGKWLKVNKAFSDMVGYTEEELLKTDFQSITHPDDLQIDLDYLTQMLERKINTYHLEKRYFRKDGQIIWISLNVTLAWRSDGKSNYFIAQIQNITDRRQAEAAQEKLMTQLTNSNMELERFAYVASHDMQEPLRMIVCFSDILMKDYSNQLIQEAKQYLEIVSDSGKRMQEMIQDLLEYSRVSNEARLFKAVDGARFLEHALENIKIPIEEANAEISYDKLPSFIGNPIQFMRLLQNLIINGIKYQAKGITPQVHIGVEDRGKEWCIFVQDNGLGIPDEFVEQIFQPFRRLHTWDVIKGTGLGLAICKKIVESHGGKIWVGPAPEQGSIFYFTLPKTQLTESL